MLPLEEEGKVLPLSSVASRRVASHRIAARLCSLLRRHAFSARLPAALLLLTSMRLRHISRPSVHEGAFFNRTTYNELVSGRAGITRPGETIVNGQVTGAATIDPCMIHPSARL